MPWGLKHFQQSGQLHFLTFSCYRRRPKFATPDSRACFESSLERVRESYGLCVYVVMPEHVHLLVNEPERGCLSQMPQSLKQSVARTLALRAVDSFWGAGPPKPPNYSSGCPVQAPLGRGCSVVTETFAIAN